jgi:tetratricopeptide (TPR) repeat protein
MKRTRICALLSVLAISACARDDATASNCETLADRIADYPPHGASDAKLVSALSELNACPASPDREFALAVQRYNAGDTRAATTRMESLGSDDPKLEPKRLAFLYWAYYNTFDSGQEEKAKRLVADAKRRFPESPYTKMIAASEVCYEGSCAQALPDLMTTDAQLHQIRALPLLALAYADYGDFKSAAATFDKLKKEIGTAAPDDMSLYGAVVTYANVGRLRDAKAAFAEFEASNPNVHTSNLDKAKEVIATAESNSSP